MKGERINRSCNPKVNDAPLPCEWEKSCVSPTPQPKRGKEKKMIKISSISRRFFSLSSNTIPSPIPVTTRYTHLPREQEVPATIAPVFSLDQTDTEGAFKAKKREYIEKYQSHKLDTGSSQIQGLFLVPYLFFLSLIVFPFLLLSLPLSLFFSNLKIFSLSCSFNRANSSSRCPFTFA